MNRVLCLPISLLLAGCTVGPDYVKPEIATPSGYQGVPATKGEAPLSAPVASEADLSQWWLQIGDAELQKLIGAALNANLDLASAISRVREAREQETIAGAAGLPKVSANGATIQAHSNSNPLASLAGGGSSSGGSGAPTSGSTNIHFYSLGFDATWEIDVFGGVRRSVESAKANTEAAVWQVRDGEVSLTAEIANDYMALRADQARIVTLNAEYTAQQDTLKLVRARAKAGFITQLDVNQQQSLAATTGAEIPELQADARAQEHAIAVLLAQQPESLAAELDRTAPLPAVPATLPVGLPSDLLRRRPDVREAERKLAAANAQIGVAVADAYPKFNLLALLSMAGPAISNVVSTNNLAEGGVGQITWSIFNGGQIHANIRAKKEEDKQALYAYQEAVLKAIQDTEDALVRYDNEQRKIIYLKQAEDRSSSSVKLATQQYRVGLVTYLNVLSAQADYRKAEDSLLQSRQMLSQDLISLYKALGGGWSEAEPKMSER